MRFIQNWRYGSSGGLDTVDVVFEHTCEVGNSIFVIVTNDFTTALGATYGVNDDGGFNLYENFVSIDGGHYGVHLFGANGIAGDVTTVTVVASDAGNFTVRIAELAPLNPAAVADAVVSATGTGTLALAALTPPGASFVFAGIAQDQGGQTFAPVSPWMAVQDGRGGEGAYRTTLGSGALSVGWTLGSSATWYMAAASIIDTNGANQDGVAWMPVAPAIGGCRRVAVPSGMGD